MKKISILGSTGSIGTQSLEIIKLNPEKFHVIGLSSGKNNLPVLAKQIMEFNPQLVCVPDKEAKDKLLNLVKDNNFEILYDENGLKEFVINQLSDTIISAMVGISGLKPNIWAIETQKNICLANKETMVVGGSLINNLLDKYHSQIIPLDSEHSAIFQCLRGRNPKSMNKLILTGSGGPFLNKAAADFKNISLDEALNHPKWKMGPKITIDSSTLMNKGLEIIEAKWLFKIPANQIEVIIHPESIMHSAVEFIDGSIIAQFGKTTMLGPIHYGLFYPDNNYPSPTEFIDLTNIAHLNFFKPDLTKFPLLKLAMDIACSDESYACAFNAANEIANEAFLNQKIQYLDIAKIIQKTIANHKVQPLTNLEAILEVDRISRKMACESINKIFV